MTHDPRAYHQPPPPGVSPQQPTPPAQRRGPSAAVLWILGLGCGCTAIIVVVALIASAAWFFSSIQSTSSTATTSGGSTTSPAPSSPPAAGTTAPLTEDEATEHAIDEAPDWAGYEPTGTNPLDEDGDPSTEGTLVPETVAEGEAVDAPVMHAPDIASDRFSGEWIDIASADLMELQLGTAPADCSPDPLPANLSSDAMDRAEFERHIEALVACIERPWIDSAKLAGYEIPRPEVTVVGSGSELPVECAVIEGEDLSEFFETSSAVYCPGDSTIYLPHGFFDDYLDNDRDDLEIILFLAVAHEYGHHLQYTFFILDDAPLIEQNAGAVESESMTRRIELQAECLGAMSMAKTNGPYAPTQRDYDILTDPLAYSDDPVYGRAPTAAFWVQRGFLSNGDARFCNVFREDEAAVR